MCGIAGIVDLRYQRQIDEASILRMCDVIRHRGPNEGGIYLNSYMGMGMRRLSIIDVKEGKQPISNENNSIHIIFNGEIYNHEEIKNELISKGHVFKTKTDTESILHLYEERGIECLDYLRGMFAFAIWDENKRRLFIARDRLGIKPLFWGICDDQFMFGSEMKSLLTIEDMDRSIDWNGFDAFFTYNYIPAPITIYKNIKKLPPAHYIVIEDGNIRINRYWDLNFNDKFTKSQKKIEDEFIGLFQESIKMRLMSEVPLAAFLSGGLDSGMVVAMMTKQSQNQVESFTAKFSGETGNFIDESPFAEEIANKYKCNHHTLLIRPKVKLAMDACAFAFDEPFADDSIIPTFHICEAARNYATVILTGLGGDENFGGYERYLGFSLSRFYRMVPQALHRKVIFPLVNTLKEESGGGYRINHLKRFVAGQNSSQSVCYQNFIGSLHQNERKKLYSAEVARKIEFDYVDNLGRMHFERLNDGDWLDRALYQDICMYMPDDILALSDRVGMYHSLELRVPFVDHKLVEFCARIPSSMKIKNFQKKYFLKKIAEQYLPKSALNHRKQGFSAPLAEWLKKDLFNEAESCLSKIKASKNSYFNSDFVKKLMDDHYSHKSLNDKIIFALMIFQKWSEKQSR